MCSADGGHSASVPFDFAHHKCARSGRQGRKYVKTIYNCHKCAGTLDGGDIDGDGELTVLDIDHIIG
jgi:hypothetical protein